MTFSFLEYLCSFYKYLFFYYANEESDHIIGGFTKTVQHVIKNISRNIGAVFLVDINIHIGHVQYQYSTMAPRLLRVVQYARSITGCQTDDGS